MSDRAAVVITLILVIAGGALAVVGAQWWAAERARRDAQQAAMIEAIARAGQAQAQWGGIGQIVRYGGQAVASIIRAF